MHRKQITDEIWINVFKLIWVNSEFFLASNLLKEKILVDVFDVFKGNKNINKLLSILQQENYDQLTEFLNYDDHLVLTLSHFLTADIWQAFDRWYAFNKPEAINTRAQKIKAIDKPRLEKTTITQPSQQSSSRNNDPELQKKKTDIIKFLWVNAELFKHPLSKELLDPKHPLHMLIKVFYTGFAQSKQKFAYFQAALPYLINGDFEKMGRVLDNNLNLVDVLYNYLSTQSKSEMDKSLKQWFVEYTKVDYYVNINRNKRMDRLRNTISEEATLKITQEQIKAAKEQDENARQVIKQAMRILTSNLEFFQASMVQGNATLFSSWVKKK